MKKNLPNLIVVGAQKAGTTTFYDKLQMYPDFYLPHKEIKYFHRDEHYEKGLNWYLDHFNGYEGQRYIGDITPDYMAYSWTAERIYKDLGPDTKIIFLLREPVARAYSQFNFYRMNGVESSTSFEKVLKEEYIDLSMSTFKNWYTPANYISRSIYLPQIQRYLEYFDRKNIHIIIFEELFIERQPKALEELESFLGIQLVDFYQNNVKSNPSLAPRSKLLVKLKYFIQNDLRLVINLVKKIFGKGVVHSLKNSFNKASYTKTEKLSPEEKASIRKKYFQSSIDELEEFLGRKISSWH